MEASNKLLWEETLQKIAEPPLKKRTFARIQDARLAVVMIEFRTHEWLSKVLFNAAHVYGGQSDVALVVVCGLKNHAYLQREITASWTNVIIHVLPHDNVTIPIYNSILTSESFYEIFDPCKSILLIQTDTLSRKRVPWDLVEKYAYIGAPWGGLQINGPTDSVVGNGGYSLRNVSVMKKTCREHVFDPKKDIAEDLFFAKHGRSIEFPVTPADVAWGFSVEHVPHPDPCGMHQAWRFHSREKLESWLKNLPGTMLMTSKLL